jgi:alkylmercury lyase
MVHQLRIGERELYAWCAWDTLFLPELVGANTQVRSTCRSTGEAIQLTVTPEGLEAASPPGAVISFVVPAAAAVNKDVITSFCHYVHFFSFPDAARAWLSEHPDAFLLRLRDAYDLGRRINRARYGEWVA